MPPSLAITSWFLVGIPTTSCVLWSQTGNMAAFHCMLVHLWSFSCFFIQVHTVSLGLRSGELPGHLISWIWGRSAQEIMGKKCIPPSLRQGFFVRERWNFVKLIIEACSVSQTFRCCTFNSLLPQYYSSRSDFGYKFVEIFLFEKQLRVSVIRGVAMWKKNLRRLSEL